MGKISWHYLLDRDCAPITKNTERSSYVVRVSVAGHQKGGGGENRVIMDRCRYCFGTGMEDETVEITKI